MKGCKSIRALKPAQSQYSYPALIIPLVKRIISFTSWRSLEKNFKLWAKFFNLPTPNFLTIRQWFLKFRSF